MYGTWVEKWSGHRKSSAASNWYCGRNRHIVVIDSEAVVPKDTEVASIVVVVYLGKEVR